MLRQRITIINKLGLHARAAAKLVNHASRFKSDIEIIKHDQMVNGKSIMGVMMLAANKGSELELAINGEDEAEMMIDLVALINNKFEEHE